MEGVAVGGGGGGGSGGDGGDFGPIQACAGKDPMQALRLAAQVCKRECVRIFGSVWLCVCVCVAVPSVTTMYVSFARRLRHLDADAVANGLRTQECTKVCCTDRPVVFSFLLRFINESILPSLSLILPVPVHAGDTKGDIGKPTTFSARDLDQYDATLRLCREIQVWLRRSPVRCSCSRCRVADAGRCSNSGACPAAEYTPS